jgi:hypothetical protein
MHRFFARRELLVSLVTLFVAGLPAAAFAATPASGTLSTATPKITYTSGPFTASNPTPVPEADAGPRCNALAQCDSFALTVDLPDGYAAAHPKDSIKVSVTWTPAATDVDMWVYQGTVGDLDGSDDGFEHSASSANPEEITLPVSDGAYTIKIVPYAATGSTATTTIELISPPPPPNDADGDGIPDADDKCAGTPAGTPVNSTGCPLGAGDPATCAAPGLTLLTDEDLDNLSATPGTDLLALKLQQPRQAGTADRIEDQLLVFTIQTDAGITPSSATSWFASFVAPNGTVMGVRMTGDNTGNPVFQTYSVGASNSGAQDGRFVEGTRNAESSSSFDSAGGVITIVVKATALGFTAPGQEMKGFNAGVTQTTGGLATAVDDGMPENDLSRSTVSYVLHDNTVCGGTQLKGIQPPPPASGLAPRYQIHVAPPGMGDDAGEPSVGVNWATKHSMFISYTIALRQTYQEDVVPPLLPASCPALWEDKPGTLTTLNSLDPILFTDEATGRTFNSQLSGDNSLMEYTDDDGENWTPAQAGPPNGGADHQAVATGPYPADSVPPNALWPATGDKRAVYYCSQSVATAFCSRSDDGGTTFGPGFTFKNTECSAGALHGHVKVAPDGTVYVPDSSQCVLPLGESAGHVGTFVSEDAGQTWAFRPVPMSTGGDGSDPSIGIATDGTTYMCYPNADSTVHVAWSSDKGKTWEGGVDIGAAAGLTQTRFPHMIAGDPDRASCAFLGTTGARPESPSNDGSSLDFQGVWHGYVATTYDHGKTWHLANVTPNDPVQGWGGVGPDGTNRNLLDFNDLQIDSEGRTYFALADGCTGGCVKDPSANAFTAKATIVRQTGGRSLFAAFDNLSNTRYNNPTPLQPAAACARADLSVRSPVQAKFIWSAPDTGGSAITNYKVYRGLAPTGPFTFLGDAGDKTTFVDTTTSPSVEKYYYNVEAFNAVGKAPISNTIELPINAVEINTCVIPGETIILDATGDGVADDTDIVFLAVAEPAEYPDHFVITEKVMNFTAGQPPADSFYPVLFPTRGSTYIALDATQGLPKFTYGTYETLPQGVLAFTEAGTLHADSAYDADGTFRMIVPRSVLGDPAVGAVISGFDARSRVGAQSATSRDTAGPSDYTVRGIDLCAAPGIVTAALQASTLQGPAPLGVTFTLSGTVPEGKTLASYSLNLGDGSAVKTGTFGGGSATVAHTYSAVGVYRAKLTVTDSDGASSANLAEQTITVLAQGAPPVGTGDEIGNNTVGGAVPALSLLVLALAAGGRRRRRR